MAHFFLVAQTARGPVWGVADGVPEEHLHWVYREGIEPDADPDELEYDRHALVRTKTPAHALDVFQARGLDPADVTCPETLRRGWPGAPPVAPWTADTAASWALYRDVLRDEALSYEGEVHHWWELYRAWFLFARTPGPGHAGGAARRLALPGVAGRDVTVWNLDIDAGDELVNFVWDHSRRRLLWFGTQAALLRYLADDVVEVCAGIDWSGDDAAGAEVFGLPVPRLVWHLEGEDWEEAAPMVLTHLMYIVRGLALLLERPLPVPPPDDSVCMTVTMTARGTPVTYEVMQWTTEDVAAWFD